MNKIETSIKDLEIHIANELDDKQWENWQEVLKYINELEKETNNPIYELSDGLYMISRNNKYITCGKLTSIEEALDNYIPKQKIKDKIEELENKGKYQGNGYYCIGAKLILQELLEETNE